MYTFGYWFTSIYYWVNQLLCGPICYIFISYILASLIIWEFRQQIYTYTHSQYGHMTSALKYQYITYHKCFKIATYACLLLTWYLSVNTTFIYVWLLNCSNCLQIYGPALAALVSSYIRTIAPNTSFVITPIPGLWTFRIPLCLIQQLAAEIVPVLLQKKSHVKLYIYRHGKTRFS